MQPAQDMPISPARLEELLGNDYHVHKLLRQGSNRQAWLVEQNGKLRVALVDIPATTPNSKRTQAKGLDTNREVEIHKKLNEYFAKSHSDPAAHHILPLIHSIKYHDASGDHRITVMPYCSEGTLEDVCAKASTTTKEKLSLLSHVATAVKATHDAGVLHRDIKKSNIAVDRTDKGLIAYLIDYQIACEIDDCGTDYHPGITRGGHETVDANVLTHRSYTQLSDLFSLAKTGIDILTNVPTFEFDSNDSGLTGVDHLNKRTLVQQVDGRRQIDAAAYKQALDSAIRLIPRKARKLKPVLHKMLSLDDEVRYQSAREAQHAFADAATSWWRRKRSSSAVIGMAAAAILSLGTAGTWTYNRVEEAMREARAFHVVPSIQENGVTVVNNEFRIVSRIADHDQSRSLRESNEGRINPIILSKSKNIENAEIGLDVEMLPTIDERMLDTHLDAVVYVPGYKGKHVTFLGISNGIPNEMYAASQVRVKLTEIIPEHFDNKAAFIYVDVLSPDHDLWRSPKPVKFAILDRFMTQAQKDEYQEAMSAYHLDKDKRDVTYPHDGRLLARLAIPITSTDENAGNEHKPLFIDEVQIYREHVYNIYRYHSTEINLRTAEKSFAEQPKTQLYLIGPRGIITKQQIDSAGYDSSSSSSQKMLEEGIVCMRSDRTNSIPEVEFFSRLGSKEINNALGFYRINIPSPKASDYVEFAQAKRRLEQYLTTKTLAQSESN